MSCCNDGAEIGIGLTIIVTGDIDSTITVSNDGTVSTITIAVPNGGYHRYHLWLSDSDSDPEESLVVPDVTGETEWIDFTDSAGDASFSIEHSGTSRSWYVWGYLNSLESGDAAVTIGS